MTDRDYIKRTIATVRNHRDADNCWPQWANIFADEIERQASEIERLWKLVESAWGVIANASHGDWLKESDEWQEAAARWRSEFHAALNEKEPDADA